MANWKKLLSGTVLAVGLLSSQMSTAAHAADKVRIALLVKSLGNGFFDAAHKGADEAAKELGNVEVIYTGPTSTTASGQIDIINSLIAQKVNAIAVSANDGDALVPSLKKAMQRGITVISWDSAVAKPGREMHLAPSSDALIGNMCDKLAADALPGGKGDVAILSATATSTNQNTWIAEMKKALPKYPGVNVVTTVYGDDLADKSYRETEGILKTYPNVKVIVAPTSVGIVAAAQAVEDAGKVGQVFVTGLGLPSELAGHVDKGSVKSFAIWNPIDLGYAATTIAYELATKKAEAKPGAEIPIGRMGKTKLDENDQAAMADPFVYDKSNVHEFAKIF
ncbi:rhamnose-binding protein [Faunimonas pinastri]|uniref:Rhamnose-binding protein n=1 Tax=Faunimonas pinastri TaxID=1855383 RepID=A0A1H9NTX1_9HYPH|nr:rhamnose ABC transporter substrate-binding protein [Faunimonas pinastri]SER39348.1 rhamnose-binding protein [Faunimonas pinastri]